MKSCNVLRKMSFVKTLSITVACATVCMVCFSCGKVPKRGMTEIRAKGKTVVIEEKSGKGTASATFLIDHDYYIDRTEVTQGFFTRVSGYNPSAFSGDTSRPVESVSWIETVQFCNARSAQEKLEPCYNPNLICNRKANGYRLPSEAEWEYACNAGAKRPVKVNKKACWYSENSGKSSHPVATVKPNRFGTFDMIGNVWEWCDDRYYPLSSKRDTTVWQLGPKTLRGGSWSSTPDMLGVARDGGDPMGKSNGVGFRCVRNN